MPASPSRTRPGSFATPGTFPNSSLGALSQIVEFDELLGQQATRVVVISPEHAVEEFLAIVEQMGLHKVSYNVGWTAWLDIAPEGVNKATALERVRGWLGIPRSRVMAVGDGRNDIDMLRLGVGTTVGAWPWGSRRTRCWPFPASAPAPTSTTESQHSSGKCRRLDPNSGSITRRREPLGTPKSD